MATVGVYIGPPVPMTLDEVRVRRARLVDVIAQFPRMIERARKVAPGAVPGKRFFWSKPDAPESEAGKMAAKLDELKARLAEYDRLLSGEN